MKLFFTVITSALIVAFANGEVQAIQSKWEVAGKTSTGEELILDTNSVRQQKGGVRFNYRFKGSEATREHVDVRTTSCNRGDIENEPFWIVEGTVIKADSTGSIRFLKRICSLAYSQTNASKSFVAPASAIELAEIDVDYLFLTNYLLRRNNHPAISLSDEDKINAGMKYCLVRANGITDDQISQALIQESLESQEPKAEFSLKSGYFVATSVAATNSYCPQYK